MESERRSDKDRGGRGGVGRGRRGGPTYTGDGISPALILFTCPRNTY